MVFAGVGDQVPGRCGSGNRIVFCKGVLVNARGILLELAHFERLVGVGDLKALPVGEHQKPLTVEGLNTSSFGRCDGLAISIVGHDEHIFALLVSVQVLFNENTRCPLADS